MTGLLSFYIQMYPFKQSVLVWANLVELKERDSLIFSVQASFQIKRAKFEKKVNSNILNKCICLFPFAIIREARKENNANTK